VGQQEPGQDELSGYSSCSRPIDIVRLTSYTVVSGDNLSDEDQDGTWSAARCAAQDSRGHRETVTYSSELDKTYGLLATDKAWYITRLLREDDYVDFGGLFPELAKQIGWTRGVRLADRAFLPLSALLESYRDMARRRASWCLWTNMEDSSRSALRR